ncbi:hypothetical protein PCE1_004971 [Barthelona sp. PCE]
MGNRVSNILKRRAPADPIAMTEKHTIHKDDTNANGFIVHSRFEQLHSRDTVDNGNSALRADPALLRIRSKNSETVYVVSRNSYVPPPKISDSNFLDI